MAADVAVDEDGSAQEAGSGALLFSISLKRSHLGTGPRWVIYLWWFGLCSHKTILKGSKSHTRLQANGCVSNAALNCLVLWSWNVSRMLTHKEHTQTHKEHTLSPKRKPSLELEYKDELKAGSTQVKCTGGHRCNTLVRGIPSWRQQT